jgi:predicted transcriptional regulator
MPRSYEEVRQIACELPEDQRILLAEALFDSIGQDSSNGLEVVAAWQKEVGEPEAGYEEWFRAGVEEALADASPGIPHEEAMKQFHNAILKARKMKATA